VIGCVGVLQLDSVNVLCRSHYLPLFARLGPYSRTTLDRMCWADAGDREMFEYFWGKKASVLPLRCYPLLHWRMRAAERQVWNAPLDPDLAAPWSVVAGMRRLTVERPGLVDDVLAMVTERGPITAGEASPDDLRRKPVDVLLQAQLSADEARRELIRMSARTLGVATAGTPAVTGPRVRSGRRP
jgi:uncharacterized protein YcaQ